MNVQQTVHTRLAVVPIRRIRLLPDSDILNEYHFHYRKHVTLDARKIVLEWLLELWGAFLKGRL